jgi:hypothetical protein
VYLQAKPAAALECNPETICSDIDEYLMKWFDLESSQQYSCNSEKLDLFAGDKRAAALKCKSDVIYKFLEVPISN